jgi:hypothetical protein
MMIMFPFAVYGRARRFGDHDPGHDCSVCAARHHLSRIHPNTCECGQSAPHPLIAHNPAGFGGGVVSDGLMVFLIVWKALLVGGITGSVARSACIGYHKMWEDAGSMPPVC